MKTFSKDVTKLNFFCEILCNYFDFFSQNFLFCIFKHGLSLRTGALLSEKTENKSSNLGSLFADTRGLRMKKCMGLL